MGPIITSKIIDDAGDADLTLAKSLGFAPVEFVDLEAENTGTEKESPVVIKAPPVEDILDQKKPDKPQKIISNAAAADEIRQVVINVQEHNKRPYIENVNTSRLGPPWERFNNVCGQLPYYGEDQDIFTRPMTYREGLPLANALQARSDTSMIDVLSKIVSVADYRNLAIADHIHFLYLNLLSSQPESATITWTSDIYEHRFDNTVIYDFDIHVHYLQIDPKLYKEYSSQGFTVPRVRDLEINALIEAAALDNELSMNINYLIDRIPYIDVTHPEVATYIEKAKGEFVNANFHGRLEYILNQPMGAMEKRLEKFKAELGNFGVIEYFTAHAPISAKDAVTLLEDIEEKDQIQIEEMERAKAAIASGEKFKPAGEVQVLNRKPWSFFPFI